MGAKREVWVAKHDGVAAEAVVQVHEATEQSRGAIKHGRGTMLQFREASMCDISFENDSRMVLFFADDVSPREQLEGNRRALRALLKERKVSMRLEQEGETMHHRSDKLCAGRAGIWMAHEKGDINGTVMLRNIPNQYTRLMLCEQLARQGLAGKYDFIYLPIDRTSARNMGYAFINFRSTIWKQEFIDLFDGMAASKCLPGFDSAKVCRVRRAQVQGRAANMAKFAQPAFMEAVHAHDEWQPVFFDKTGVQIVLDTVAPKGCQECTTEFVTPTTPESLAEMLRPALQGPNKSKSNAGAVRLSLLPSGAAKALEFVPGAVAVLSPLPPSAATAREFIPGVMSDIDDAIFALPPAEVVIEEALAEAKVKAKEAARARTLGTDASVRSQIEYYFSERNVCRDIYLLSCMDGEGWVGLELLVRFPRLQVLVGTCGAVALCSASLAGSIFVEVSESGQKVRVRNPEVRAACLQTKASSLRTSPLFGPGTVPCQEHVGSSHSSPKLGLMPSPNLKAMVLAARCQRLELSIGTFCLPRIAHTKRSTKRAPQPCKPMRRGTHRLVRP